MDLCTLWARTRGEPDYKQLARTWTVCLCCQLILVVGSGVNDPNLFILLPLLYKGWSTRNRTASVLFSSKMLHYFNALSPYYESSVKWLRVSGNDLFYFSHFLSRFWTCKVVLKFLKKFNFVQLLLVKFQPNGSICYLNKLAHKGPVKY